MSEWKGLHNPERHHPYGRRIVCDWCLKLLVGGTCYDDCPCRCCLEAEIERLTAELAEREAAIQRVREVADGLVPVTTGHPQADQMTRIQALKDADAIRRALDGGE